MKRWLFAIMMWCLASPLLAAEAGLSARLTLDGAENGVVLGMTARTGFRVFTLDDPKRVVVDFPEIDWRLDPPRPGEAMRLIEAVRFGLARPGVSRMVIDLKRAARVTQAFTAPGEGGAPDLFVLKLSPETEEAFAASVEKAEETPSAPSENERVIVAIDAGHGGRDAGASFGGVIEKDLVLDYAFALAAEFDSLPGFEAFLIRETDEFLRLRTRVERAREAGADVMISIHADALDAGVARGASVYTLSEEASDAEAAALVESNNRADEIEGASISAAENDIASILVNLSRRFTDDKSRGLAASVAGELENRSTVLRGRAIQSGGFRVLKAPDVPSILVELGFLNSASDRERLTSEEGRAALVAAIVEGVRAWVVTQDGERYAPAREAAHGDGG